MTPSRRQLVAGIACLPIVAAVPHLPIVDRPLLAPIADELRLTIGTIRQFAARLALACDGRLSDQHRAWLDDIIDGAHRLPDIDAEGRYRRDQLQELRYELLTPLTGLCGFAELLIERAPRLPAEAAEICEAIHRQGLHIAGHFVPRIYEIATGEPYPSP